MYLIGIAIVVVIAVLAWFFTRSEEEAVAFEPQRVTATTGQLTTTVELSGSAAAAQTASLSFASGGEVDSVDVAIGDEVSIGDALARLDDADAQRQLETAEVQLRLAQLKLEELLASPTASAIAASERILVNAQAQVINARHTLQQINEPPDASAIDAAEQAVANANNQLSNAEQALADLTEVTAVELAAAQQGVANAEAQLSTAEQALTELTEGPSDATVASAEQAVANAASQLSNAEQALEDLISEPPAAEIASAEQAVASASAQLSSAEQALEALSGTPSVADIETARSAVAQARNPVANTQRDIQRTEEALESAHERFCDDIVALPEVCRATLPLNDALLTVLESKAENSGSTLERRARELLDAQADWESAINSHEAASASLMAAEARLAALTDPEAEQVEQAAEAVTAAEAALRAAEAKLEELLSPASDAKIYQAGQVVLAARAGLAAAQANQEELLNPADQSDIDQAEQVVTAARTGLLAARTDLNDLLDGPNPDDIYQAEQALAAAQANRDAANAQLAELLAPPTENDILEAELSLASAQSGLTEAQTQYDELMSGPTATTIAQQEQNVRLAEITYEQALAAMEDLVISAPFDGVVEEVTIEPGDRIGAGATALVISTRNEIVVALTVTEAEIFELEELQIGVASFDAIAGVQYPVRITSISRVPSVEQGVVTYAVEATVLSPLAIQAARADLQALGVTVPAPQPQAAGAQGGGGQGAASADPQAVARFRAWLESLDLPEGVTVLQVVQAIANGDPLPGGVELPEDFDISDEQRAQLRALLARFAGGGGAAGGTAAVDDNRQLPVDGMSATVTILTAVRDEAVLVSTSAVRQIDGAFYVAIPGEGVSWERLPVQIGETDGTNVEILSGLEDGATVLVGADSEGIAYSATQLPGGGVGGGLPGGAGPPAGAGGPR